MTTAQWWEEETENNTTAGMVRVSEMGIAPAPNPDADEIVSAITETAVNVRFRMSKWEGFKYDGTLSKELADTKGAVRRSMRVNKRVVPEEWIKPVLQAFGRVYAHHIETTLPWLDTGERVLANRMYHDYVRGHAKYEREAFTALEVAYQTYPDVLREAPRRLGAAYKATDFPPQHKLKGLFSIELTFLPIPANDIRAKGISRADIDKMNAAKNAEIMRAVEGAMGDAWQRVYTVVSHLSERLKAYNEREEKLGRGEKVGRDGVFRDTVIENIRELAQTLPKLNFVGDKALDEMAGRLERSLCAVDADQLRESGSAREKALKDADRILRDMSGMGLFE